MAYDAGQELQSIDGLAACGRAGRLVGVVGDRAVFDPARACLAGSLDDILREWPFVRYLKLEKDGESYSVSEFMLTNAALLLDQVIEPSETAGVALLTADAGPLALVTALIRTLAEVQDVVRDDRHPNFEFGVRLINGEGGAEVEFRGYGQLDGSSFRVCAPENVTHFQFHVPQSHRRGSGALYTRTVNDVVQFPRSSHETGPMRAGGVVFDTEMVTYRDCVTPG